MKKEGNRLCGKWAMTRMIVFCLKRAASLQSYHSGYMDKRLHRHCFVDEWLMYSYHCNDMTSTTDVIAMETLFKDVQVPLRLWKEGS